MATNIFDTVALVPGTTMQSDALESCGNLVLDIELVSDVKKDFLFKLMGHEGTGNFKAIRDEKLDEIQFNLFGTNNKRLAFEGINTDNFKLYVEVPEGVTGTLLVAATKTDNANS